MFAFSFSQLSSQKFYVKEVEHFIITYLNVNGFSHFEVQDMSIDAKNHRLTLVILFRSRVVGHTLSKIGLITQNKYGTILRPSGIRL